MKVIKIHGQTGPSTILIGESFQNLGKYIPKKDVVIITDINVRHYYGNDFPPQQVIEIGTGEEIKNLDTVQGLFDRLMDLEVDRSCFIVGIGGGILCDIVGFVASTYLRGVRFGFVPTTLLAQVDASVGGKNGVNFRGYKNMVGVFNQPEFVICDIGVLHTLPAEEISCGLAEILKHAAIGDTNLFLYLEGHYQQALRLKTEIIERLIHDSVAVKSSIVNKDEREQGERRKLNFGHTFGHAIEKTTGMPHGQAISVGMVIASRISAKRGILPSEDAERIEALLRKLNLPTCLELDGKAIVDALIRDKKREGGTINFVLLQGLGHAVVAPVAIKELEAAAGEVMGRT